MYKYIMCICTAPLPRRVGDETREIEMFYDERFTCTTTEEPTLYRSNYTGHRTMLTDVCCPNFHVRLRDCPCSFLPVVDHPAWYGNLLLRSFLECHNTRGTPFFSHSSRLLSSSLLSPILSPTSRSTHVLQIYRLHIASLHPTPSTTLKIIL